MILPAQHDQSVESYIAMLPKGTDIQSRSLVQWGSVRIAVEKQVPKTFLHERQLEWTAKLKCVPLTNYVIHSEVAGHEDAQLVVEKVTLRVPREPMDFLARAVEAGHPRSHAIALPKEFERVVDWNRDASSYELHTHRISFVKQWSERAKQLKDSDESFLKGSPEYFRNILKGKRLALWSEMLTFYEYPDTELIKHMAEGFPLFGWMLLSCFPFRLLVASSKASIRVLNPKYLATLTHRWNWQLGKRLAKRLIKDGWRWTQSKTLELLGLCVLVYNRKKRSG